MSDKETNPSFKEWYESISARKEINELSWFGIVIGLSLSILSTYQVLCSTGFKCVFFNLMAFVGLVLISLGVFLPLKLKKTVNIIKKSLSFVGGIILKLLILPVYLVICLINFFKHNKYSQNFDFVQWEENDTLIVQYHNYENLIKKKNKNAILDIVNGLYYTFAKNKMYIFVPIVTLLIVLGMIMFFASTNAVFSFVYTLF